MENKLLVFVAALSLLVAVTKAVAPAAPTITPASNTIEVGHSLTLTCASTTSGATYEFFDGPTSGTPLGNGGIYTVTADTLVIVPTAVSAAKDYICEATVITESSSSTTAAYVTVVAIKAPTLSAKPSITDIEADTDVTFTCAKDSANGDPKEYRFFNGYKDITGTDKTATTLKVKITKDDNDKKFKCQFFNTDTTDGKKDSNELTAKIKVHPVEPDSILISEITSTSAKVTWKAPYSEYTYSVSIIPTADGARVEPNPVPRGTTMVTLKNLSPGTVYQVTIWAVSSALSMLSGPSKKSFQTPDEQLETLSTAGLAVAVTCLVIIIVLIVLIVIIFRRIDQNATRCNGTGNNTHIPMSNLGFERDHQPRKAPTPVVGKSSEFKTWLLSKQVSEDTYELIQREGFHDPAMFALLRPDEVSRLAIKPMAQELLLKDIVESFNKGETPFQTCGTAGDELYDDVTNEKYEHLRVA